MTAISLEKISKRYRIYRSQQDRLRELLSFGRNTHSRDFWALQDISLKVESGASIGLLGRNGAGKSTLLQIISGVLQPTTGTALAIGRIAALLQLGAGFNPEFTGRENAFMNGLLLGIDRREMMEHFDEIESFADLGEFMDQPVKSYSSGMRARLGFAVAVNVEPDILLVDETLSVGDGVFRATGIQKMRELQDSGATIVFVTHSTNMIKNFCTEAALLHKGRLITHGDTSETVDQYEALLSSAAAKRGHRISEADHPPDLESEEGLESGEKFQTPAAKESPKLKRRGARLRHGTGEAKIQNVDVLDERGDPLSVASPDSTMTVRVHVRYLTEVEDSVLRITLRNKAGLDIFSTSTNLEKVPIRRRRAGDQIVVDFAFEPSLRQGPYSVAAGVSLGSNKNIYLDWIDVTAAFEIGRPPGRSAFGGMVHLPTKVKIFEPEQVRNSKREPRENE